MPAPMALRYASFAVHCSRNAAQLRGRFEVEPVGVFLRAEHAGRERVEAGAWALDLDVDPDPRAGHDRDHGERLRVRQAEPDRADAERVGR